MGTLPNISTGSASTTPPATKTRKGQDSVNRVAAILQSRGYHVKSKLPYISKFDLLCNGKRVEVKTADMREDSSWVVNIHRHGILDEGQVDVYIFELHAFFFPAPLLLFYPSPIGIKTLSFSLQRLIRGKYWDRVEVWEMVEPIAKNPKLPEIFAAQEINSTSFAAKERIELGDPRKFHAQEKAGEPNSLSPFNEFSGGAA